MADQKSTRTFVCSCFFESNLYVQRYKLHVSYKNREQFMKEYTQILRNRGCVTEQQFEAVVREVEAEIARRRSLGEASLRRQEEIQRTYVPLHKHVYELKEQYLAPAFLELVDHTKSQDSTKDSVLEYLSVLGDGIYLFPVFTKEFCRCFLEELEHIENSGCPKGRPNSMNNYGVLLEEYGFNERLLNPLREQYLQPIAALLFPSWGGGCLDSHKAFSVTYEPTGDTELTCHYDNAEITLNVSLGYENFENGDLFFLGLKGERWSLSSRLHCKHNPGWGLLHRGLHMHGAEAVTKGKRCNLIMWMRASCVRNKCCPMCSSPPQLLESKGADDGFRVESGQLLNRLWSIVPSFQLGGGQTVAESINTSDSEPLNRVQAGVPSARLSGGQTGAENVGTSEPIIRSRFSMSPTQASGGLTGAEGINTSEPVNDSRFNVSSARLSEGHIGTERINLSEATEQHGRNGNGGQQASPPCKCI